MPWVYAPTIRSLDREIFRVSPGKFIIREGEKLATAYALCEGWAFGFRELSAGRRHILSFFIPGDIVLLESVMLPGEASPCAVKSLTWVTACGFPLDRLAAVLNEDAAQQHEFKVAMQYCIASAYRRSAGLARRNALGRIAQLIAELSERLKRRGFVQNGRFEFPLARQHIADAIGATEEDVSRMLGTLRNEKVISFVRRSMTVLDEERLCRLADEL